MTTRYACVREGAIIAGPGPWRNFAFWTDPHSGDVMQWTAKTEAERAALGWAEVAQVNKPADASAVKDQSVVASVDESGAPIETWSWTAKTDAERAAELSLRAPDFYEALWPLLESKGHAPTAPLRQWMVSTVAAIAEADLAATLNVSAEAATALKRSALNRLDSGYTFERSDPQLVQFAALFGIAEAEMDTLWLSAATHA